MSGLGFFFGFASACGADDFLLGGIDFWLLRHFRPSLRLFLCVYLYLAIQMWSQLQVLTVLAWTNAASATAL